MSNAIRVYVTAPTPKGRLYTRYIKEGGILTADSEVPRDWPFGVNVDGVLICDADADAKLTCFELLARKELWRVQDKLPSVPQASTGDLHFAEETLRIEDFDVAVNVFTNKDRTVALITLGDSNQFEQSVELSPGCNALLSQDCLVGFYVRVPQ